MSFTVNELQEAITQFEEQIGESRSLFLDLTYGEGTEGLPAFDGIGKVEFVDTWGGEGDGAEVHVVIKVGDRYFQKNGFYSSWGENSMDGELYEVRPKQVQVTQYEEI